MPIAKLTLINYYVRLVLKIPVLNTKTIFQNEALKKRVFKISQYRVHLAAILRKSLCNWMQETLKS